MDLDKAIIWANDGLDYWHIYASLGLNELMHIKCTTLIKQMLRSLFWYRSAILPVYLNNGDSYSNKMEIIYWNDAPACCFSINMPSH